MHSICFTLFSTQCFLCFVLFWWEYVEHNVFLIKMWYVFVKAHTAYDMHILTSALIHWMFVFSFLLFLCLFHRCRIQLLQGKSKTKFIYVMRKAKVFTFWFKLLFKINKVLAIAWHTMLKTYYHDKIVQLF